jgi:hypothetical protein
MFGRGTRCPHCGKALEAAPGQAVRTLDLDYDAIVAEADASSLKWTKRGAVFAFALAVFSLVPVVGAAVAYFLLLVGQFFWTGFLIARPYQRHFSPMRRLVTRWVRRLGLLFIVVPAYGATFVPVLGLVAAPAIFSGTCWLVRAYHRFHIRREKERRPVTFAEKVLVFVLAFIVLGGLCLTGVLVYLGVLALGALSK